VSRKPGYEELEKRVEDMEAGDHMCCFYETDEEHRALLTPFMRQGLERGEKVLYIVDSRTAEQVLNYLRDDEMVPETYLESGQLAILTADEAYMREGTFDPDAMIDLLRDETERALNEGYSALRVTGEMSWALKGLPRSERLIEYEAKLNEFFPGSKCLAICQYDMRRFKPSLLLNVLMTHPIAAIGREVYDNFYYVPPRDFLGPEPEKARLSNWFNNLSEHKRAEEAMKESEEKYKTLTENSLTGIFIHQDGRYVFVNDRFAEIHGYKPEELPGKDHLELIPPDQRELVGQRASKRLEGGSSPQRYEIQRLRKVGEVIWCEMMVAPIHYRGRPAIMGNIIDITEQKQVEERLEHLNLVLYAIRKVNKLIVRERDRDRLLQGVCDQLIENRGYYNAWIVLLDENGELITTAESGLGNDFLPMIERLKRGELTDCGRKAIKQSGIVTTKDPHSACADCPLSGKYAGKGAMTVRLEHGEEFYGLASVSIPDHFATDEEEHLLFKEISEDIAFALHTLEQGEERKRAEEERKSLEAQLQQSQKMEAIGTLAGGIAHDFNNLLTTIIGNTELALMDLKSYNPLHEIMKEIKKAGERAASLTQQLLAFSRKQVIKPIALDLNQIIQETDKMLKRLIGEDIELYMALEPQLWKVNADPGQIDQVIMNLAVNARDAMPRGGKLTIETANVELDKKYLRAHAVEEQPGPYVRLSMSDTGIGMDEEIRPHIFEPFFTTKQMGKGTGLGLSTVYGIIKQSGGFIWVYSEPEQGTSFKIYLPLGEGDIESREKEQIPVKGLSGSETVLIVEDDDALRTLATKVLQRYGYRVLEAREGEEALRVTDEHEGPIQLMLTDVVMPGMDGRELAERLQPLHPEIKVIYMSGYTDDAIARHGILEPGLEFIQKPFSPEGLACKVREVLDK